MPPVFKFLRRGEAARSPTNGQAYVVDEYNATGFVVGTPRDQVYAAVMADATVPKTKDGLPLVQVWSGPKIRGDALPVKLTYSTDTRRGGGGSLPVKQAGTEGRAERWLIPCWKQEPDQSWTQYEQPWLRTRSVRMYETVLNDSQWAYVRASIESNRNRLKEFGPGYWLLTDYQGFKRPNNERRVRLIFEQTAPVRGFSTVELDTNVAIPPLGPLGEYLVRKNFPGTPTVVALAATDLYDLVDPNFGDPWMDFTQ